MCLEWSINTISYVFKYDFKHNFFFLHLTSIYTQIHHNNVRPHVENKILSVYLKAL